MVHDVFISHAVKDKPKADAVCSALESRGLRCWIAPRDILPGADWGDAIIHAISNSRVMVLVFSSNSNQSSQVRREVERAVSKGVVVVPIRIEDVTPSGALEYFLSTQHWIDALTPPLERHLRQIAESIKVLLDTLPWGGEQAISLEMLGQEAAPSSPLTGSMAADMILPPSLNTPAPVQVRSLLEIEALCRRGNGLLLFTFSAESGWGGENSVVRRMAVEVFPTLYDIAKSSNIYLCCARVTSGFFRTDIGKALEKWGVGIGVVLFVDGRPVDYRRLSFWSRLNEDYIEAAQQLLRLIR